MKKRKKIIISIAIIMLFIMSTLTLVCGENYTKRVYTNSKYMYLSGELSHSKYIPGQHCRTVCVNTHISGAPIDAIFAGYSLRKKGSGIEVANGLYDERRLMRNARDAYCFWDAQTKELREIDLVCYGSHEAYSSTDVWTVYTAMDCMA